MLCYVIIGKRRYPQANWKCKLTLLYLTCTCFELTLFTIPAIFYMCFRIEMDKSNVTWFLRGQTSDKICLCKKSQLKLIVYSLEMRRWINSNVKCTVGQVLNFFSVARWKILVASKCLWNFCSTAKQKNDNDFKTLFFSQAYM